MISPFDQLRDDERLAPRLGGFVDSTDVWMIEPCGVTRFAKRLAFGVKPARIRGENLDGHVALQAVIVSSVNRAHSAFADWRDDFVLAEP